MNLKQLQSDPVAFRAALLVDTDSGPRKLADVLDSWQRDDFEALDPAWMRVAGQDKRKAPWHIEWHDPATGRKLSKNVGSRKDANDAADGKRTELVQRTFGLTTEKSWAEFVKEYELPHVDTELTSERSREEVRRVLKRFGGDYGGEWTAADWWTALLVMAWVTGMRRSALLALRWEDINLETGEAVSRGIDNKGRKDVEDSGRSRIVAEAEGRRLACVPLGSCSNVVRPRAIGHPHGSQNQAALHFGR